MPYSKQPDRLNLLADIAEMYFLEGKNQAEISKIVGVTRSNISRMLTEARIAGIVDIQITRPINEDHNLAQALIKKFNLTNARVVHIEHTADLLDRLGKVAADELVQRIKPGWIIGTSWGTAISATVDNIVVENPIPHLKATQFLGAFGARIKAYDGHGIVHRLEDLLDAEGIYINAPFLVENKTIAESLLNNKSIKESLGISKMADIALLGVGSSELNYSSYYLADYVTHKDIIAIQKTGAIGDVCGRFFTIDGKITADEFQERLIGISVKDLKQIPIRIGVAGGAEKVKPIIGALRGGLINVLISDSATITEVIKLTE